MLRQYSETVFVSEPLDGGRDDNNVVIKAWTPKREERDVVIYRAPVEFKEVGRPDKLIHRARVTMHRWIQVTAYSRLEFDGHTWYVTQPIRRTQNPYTGSKSMQIQVERTTG